MGRKRGRGPSIVAPYTYHGDCLCWLMATYVAHTSHYEAVPEALASRYLAPWLRRRRVMANTLRIKCILSLSRPDGTDATAPYRLRRGRVIPDPPSSPPLSIFLLLFLFSPFLPFSFSFFFLFFGFATIHRQIRGVSTIFHGSTTTPS